jgi:hypothetical protein
MPVDGVPAEPAKLDYLPEKYHAWSTYKAEVKHGGPNIFKFDLTSK